jgi:hypothetical protein
MITLNKLYHLFVLFLVISIIIYIIHVIINHYKINDILFLDKKELQDFLINDPDQYYKSFTKQDLSIRKIYSLNEYNFLIKKSCRDFNVYEKNKIINCVSNVETCLKKVNEPWFDGIKACNTRWKFGCVSGNLYEGGLPHTRYDVIILPENVLLNYSDAELSKLILHEKIHVYQKMYPKDIEKYTQYHHFYKKMRRNEVDGARANPDLDEWIYNDSNNISYMALYKADSNKISDVTFYPNNSHFYEHPYEKMAYDMEKLL